MKSHPRLHLFLVSGLAFTSLWSLASARFEPAPIEPERMTSVVENNTGGFVLYQPFNDADGQISGEPFSKNGKLYPVTTVRWAPVGFLRVEEGENEGELIEHWYL